MSDEREHRCSSPLDCGICHPELHEAGGAVMSDERFVLLFTGAGTMLFVLSGLLFGLVI